MFTIQHHEHGKLGKKYSKLFCTLISLQEEEERVAEWLRHLTRKPKVRTAVGSNAALDSWSLSVTLARVDQSHLREIW